jgi:hypothetical protein
MRSEEEYEVQEIVDFGTTDGNLLYLVHWRGYDDPSDWTWEPMIGLGKVATMIRAFNAKYGIKLGFSQSRLLDSSGSDDTPSAESSGDAPPEIERRPTFAESDSTAAFSQMVLRHLLPEIVRPHPVEDAGDVSVIGALKLNDELHFSCQSMSGGGMWIARPEMVRDHPEAVITWYETLLGAG